MTPRPAERAAAVPSLLRAFVDDAGLFPPERLPMADAVQRHRKDERAAHPMLTQRFLCPISRLSELGPHLEDHDRFRLGLIADGGLGPLVTTVANLERERRIGTDIVEAPLAAREHQGREADRALGELTDLPQGIAAYLELQRESGWLEAIPVLAEHGRDAPGPRGAKIRCGGIHRELFPTAAEISAFILACAEANVAFKATAGLHHAVRYTDPTTGFDHHGFLNLLVALAVAVQGRGEAAVSAALGCTDGAELAERTLAFDDETGYRTRALLVSYGSCSTSDPIDDINRLGLAGTEA